MPSALTITRAGAAALAILLLAGCAQAGPVRLEVAKPDGSLQCEPDSGVALAIAEAELTEAGIEVLARRKGHDQQIRIQMCGTATGNLNVFQIPSESLATARALGFTPLER